MIQGGRFFVKKKGFILPLVLLILALMSGIAVVLGRLSSEKTLSLKNQEGSYYAKEITVTLVDAEENDAISMTKTVKFKKNKEEVSVEFKEISNDTYKIEVEIPSNTYITISSVVIIYDDVSYMSYYDNGSYSPLDSLVLYDDKNKNELEIDISYTSSVNYHISSDVTLKLTKQ